MGHRKNKGGNKKNSRNSVKMKTQPTRIYELWDTAKAVLRGKFTAMSAYTKNAEKSQINNLILHLKLLEKQQQTKPKTRREIIKNKN
jgi:hypothetical protein